jgi:hypothetical protein
MSLSSDSPHYTVFGFEMEGRRLNQCFSIHIGEDGCLSWIHSNRWHISLNSVTHLFVRISFLFFTKHFIEYLF